MEIGDTAAIEESLHKLTQLRRHGDRGPESSLVNLFWGEMIQRLHQSAMQVLGANGQYWPGERRAVARGRWSGSDLYYSRREHLRRHVGDPAQHHRAARAGTAALASPPRPPSAPRVRVGMPLDRVHPLIPLAVRR